MTSTQRIAATMIFLLAGAAATIGQTNRSPENAIRAADAAWLKTYVAKDVDEAVAACDDQGSLLEPNTPIATGKKAIRELIAGDFAMKDYKLVWHGDKVGVARSGDLGYTNFVAVPDQLVVFH